MVITKSTHAFDSLVQHEPRLADMLDEIQGLKDDPEDDCFCANARWQNEYKPELQLLVGWLRHPDHPVLSTEQAFEVARDRLYDALPPCRGCACQ